MPGSIRTSATSTADHEPKPFHRRPRFRKPTRRSCRHGASVVQTMMMDPTRLRQHACHTEYTTAETSSDTQASQLVGDGTAERAVGEGRGRLKRCHGTRDESDDLAALPGGDGARGKGPAVQRTLNRVSGVSGTEEGLALTGTRREG